MVNFLKKLFKNYCIADNDELIVNTIDENLLNYYLIDYNVELSENIPRMQKKYLYHPQKKIL